MGTFVICFALGVIVYLLWRIATKLDPPPVRQPTSRRTQLILLGIVCVLLVSVIVGNCMPNKQNAPPTPEELKAYEQMKAQQGRMAELANIREINQANGERQKEEDHKNNGLENK